ncbi:MAG: alpha/beta fold hydrolase [Aliishimia sp.]
MDLQVIPDFAGPGQLYGLNVDAKATPVLITHGTFSTAQTCAPLAEFFARAGHPTYVIEWRNRQKRPGRFDYDDLAEGEITAAVNAMPRPAHLVAHSGGGLAMLLGLRDVRLRAKTLSLTTLGTQATHLHTAPLKDYLYIKAMGHVGRILGYWPTSVLGLGPCDETAGILDHWLRFNAMGKFTARDGVDMFAEMASWNLPALVLSGAADTVIAPVQGCQALASALGGQAEFHLCSAATDGEDYTHSRLLRSRSAVQYVWPRILAFWAAHNVATASPSLKLPQS